MQKNSDVTMLGGERAHRINDESLLRIVLGQRIMDVACGAPALVRRALNSRTVLVLAAAAFGVLVAEIAAAQETPPSDTASPPGTASPSEPGTPAPPSEPSPPPASPPAEPPPESPPAQPPKTVAPPQVTLEEEEEEALPIGKLPSNKPRPKKKHKPKPPKAETTLAPEPAPEKAPVSAAEHAPKASHGEKPSEGDQKEKSKKDDGEGVLGPFRIGILVGTGLPSVLSFGGMIKLTRYFGAGINVGLIPTIRVGFYGEADLSYQEGDIYGRIFPFGGAFFLGAGVGYASVAGSFKTSVDTTAFQNPMYPIPNPLYVASEASVRTLVLTPTIGLLHTFGIGFTIGIDAGVQMPIAPSETHFETVIPPGITPQAKAQYIDPNDAKVRDTLDTMSRTIIPTLNLRLGWLI